MRITFIGTSHGVPEPERRCSCTMIEVDGRYYFIDMGTQAIEDLIHRGISIDAVKGIFITHPHGDHTNGLISFVDLANWYFKTSEPQVYLPDVSLVTGMKAWLTGSESGALREEIGLHVYEAGEIYDDGFVKVTAIATKHCHHAHAFLFEAEGKKILFTGDLAHPTKDFPQVAFEEELDLIVVESAHFSSDATEAVLANAKVKRVLHNHISPRWAEDLARMAKNEHHYQYGKAFDGMEITL